MIIHKDGCDAIKCKCKSVKDIDWNLADAMMKKKGVTLRQYLEIRDKKVTTRNNAAFLEEDDPVYDVIDKKDKNVKKKG